jgi:hypothetical protein
VQKEIALNTIGSASLNGIDHISQVDEVGSEIFAEWA